MLKWIDKWSGLIFGGLATGLLVFFTAGWWLRRKSAQLAKARDVVAIAAATKEIERLAAIREVIGEQVDEHDDAIEALDQRLAEQKQKIVEAAGESVEGMSDAALESAFKRILGAPD